MMNKEWTWNGKTLPFDVSEAGCMGRLLAALEGLRRNLSSFRREQDADDIISCHCGILQEFFDDNVWLEFSKDLFHFATFLVSLDHLFCQ